MRRIIRQLTCAVIGVALAVFSVTGSAQAEHINDLLFESILLGDAGGGNLSATQIDTLISANELLLGADIVLIGKVDLSGTFTPETGFTAAMLDSITCNADAPLTDCKTGFEVTFDFSGLAEDWQIVKIAVKAGGPTHPNGIFFIDPALFDPANAADDLQSASISLAEWNEYCAAAGGGVCNQQGGNPGASNFLVFASLADDVRQVPEPATVMLLGLGVMALGVAVQRKQRA